jgi:ribonuclease HII
MANSSRAILGVDEVGYGCSAGPLVVGAFYAPSEAWTLKGLGDSKKVSEKRRVELHRELLVLNCHTVLFVPVEEINEKGLGRCHHEAMARVAQVLIDRFGPPDRVIFDGNVNYLPGGEACVKADALYPSVSAASILAKVTRDTYMMEVVHKEYPLYDFKKHKGYWTAEHERAVRAHGVCAQHRTGYRNIQELMGKKPVAFGRGSL